MNILDRKDFWAGLSLIAVGALAIYIARAYPFGTTLRMGPGYFPTVLGGLLVLFGVFIGGKSLREEAQKLGYFLPMLFLALSAALVLCGYFLETLVLYGYFLEKPIFYFLALVVALAGGTLALPRAEGEQTEKLPGPWLPRLLVALLMLLIVCGITLSNRVFFYFAAVVLAGCIAYVVHARSRGEPIGASPSTRALIIVPLALVGFGLLIDRAGFIPAMMVLILGSAVASTQFKLLEQILFAVFLTALCVVVFIKALGLPYELIVLNDTLNEYLTSVYKLVDRR